MGGRKGRRERDREGEGDRDAERRIIKLAECTNLVSLINISSSFNECLHYLKMSIKASCPQWTPTL